jgi:BRCA1-associated protein
MSQEVKQSGKMPASSSIGVVNSLKPFPPPTPNLIEMPTCAVCLERMDDTAGLMTILCQHVFHCTCLQTWKGTGCPICRATNPKPKQDSYDPSNPYTQPFGSGVSNLCASCDCTDDLWICLICGRVGCGRYKNGHAKQHWKETAHSFSLELETQHVWDYAGDIWVHRLIRDKGDGKVVELPRNDPTSRHNTQGPGADNTEEDVVPRAKLDSIGLEYTHLLTSQLESQRIYFEEMVSKAADKAARAFAAADSAKQHAQEALEEVTDLRAEHRKLKQGTIPMLEKDLERERNRANKSTELARSLGKSLQDEKKVSEGLMERIDYVNKELDTLKIQIGALKEEKQELEEMNRDLTMHFSGMDKLKQLENEGQIGQTELEEGTAIVPEDKRKGGGKGKGKGKSKK